MTGAGGVLLSFVCGGYGHHYVARVGGEGVLQLVIGAVRLSRPEHFHIYAGAGGIGRMTHPVGVGRVILICRRIHIGVGKLKRQVERQVGKQSHYRFRTRAGAVDGGKVLAIHAGRGGLIHRRDGEHRLEGDVIQPQVRDYVA